MTINHTTLLLDWDTHDLCLDSLGNIALASAPYAVAQDAETQVSTFLGECWYDTSQWVDWWGQILGKDPPASVVISLIEIQALLVPDVKQVKITLAGITTPGREGVGQMLVTDTDSNTSLIPL